MFKFSFLFSNLNWGCSEGVQIFSICILNNYAFAWLIVSGFFWLTVWFYLSWEQLNLYSESAWSCSINVPTILRAALFTSKLDLILALFVSWILQELLYLGSEHRLRRIVTSVSVPYLNRSAPAKLRTQIEQIRMHLEPLNFGLKRKRKIWMLFEPQYKNFKCLLKIKGGLYKKILSGVSCPNQGLCNHTTFKRF